MIERWQIEAERLDAQRQRDNAQQALNAAVAAQQRAQSDAQAAQAMLYIATGAVQQCDAFLKKLETIDAQPPAPADPV